MTSVVAGALKGLLQLMMAKVASYVYTETEAFRQIINDCV
jgi:hypothetical protein